MDDGHILAKLLENTVAEYPDYPAVRWIVKKQTPEKLYRELNEDRNKIAGGSPPIWESSAPGSRLFRLTPCFRLRNSVICSTARIPKLSLLLRSWHR